MTSHYKNDKKPEQWTKYDEKDNTFVIDAIALDVIWGNDTRYWQIPANPGEPLELKQVAWLEVAYSTPINSIKLKDKLKYKVNFEVSIKQESAFGWSGCPVFLMVKVGSNKPTWKKVDLTRLPKDNKPQIIPVDTLTFTLSKGEAKPDDKLSVGLYEIWKGSWKGGLLIHRVMITPEPEK